MNKSKCVLILTVAASLSLAGSVLQAQSGTDKERKVEKHRIVVINKDGKEEVIESGGLRVRRGYLGVGIADLSRELRGFFGVPEESGVIISHLEEGGPADKAGIKVGDVLTRLDGKDLKSAWDVQSVLRDAKDGEQVPVEVWRNGKAQTISVTVVERERPEIDMGPILLRRGEGEGPIRLRIPELGEGAKGEVNLPSGAQVYRMRTPREAELEKKLELLEKRITELEQQLKKK